MSGGGELISAGRVGRPHGLDGSFYVEDATERLAHGAAVRVAGRETVVERRAGTEARPLIRLRGFGDREAAARLAGEQLLVAAGELDEGEYLATDLVGCEVRGLGRVLRVVASPSCEILEVGDEAVLIPFVRDAIAAVDLERRVIDVDRHFLGLDDTAG